MKRSAFLVILLALVTLLAACGGSDSENVGTGNEGDGTQTPDMETPDDSETDEGQDPDTDADTDTDQKPDDGSQNTTDEKSPVSVKKESDDKVTVSFVLPEAASKEVSVLVLTDEDVVDSWQSSPDKVLAIEQISADADGKGTVTVSFAVTSSFAVVVSYDGGREVVSVK